MEEFPEILRFVCSYLNEREIRFVVVGGVAVMYHGVPRTTVDIDLIVQFDDAMIPAFVDFLDSKGFAASVEDLRAALDEESHCTFFYKKSLLRLDIQGVNSEFDKMTLDRAISVDLLGASVMIGSAEDTIVNKILFQGEQDMRDALGILARNSENLDFGYIQSACALLGIQDHLDQFLTDYENKL
ncbi:MAG: nucleotidyl transferase AbiEii/AbiGii toxin family protein [Candidatus Thorarchaeota archaeon]